MNDELVDFNGDDGNFQKIASSFGLLQVDAAPAPCPHTQKLLSARWNIAHSLSYILASFKALGRAEGASRVPGAISPEKSSASSSIVIFPSSSVGGASRSACNFLLRRARQGSTPNDDVEDERRSAI